MNTFTIYLFGVFFFSISVFSTLLPCENIIQISESNPDAPWRTGTWGQIIRSDGKTTRSLCAVNFPAGLTGKTCKLVFENPSWASGSRRGRVFSLGSPNSPVGTFQLPGMSWPWSPANWVEGGTFGCPTQGRKGYAIVPVGATDYISWNTPLGGLKVQYS